MPTEDQPLQVEVTADGTRHLMEYRIETVTWGSDVTPEERAEEIRKFLANYDPSWSLVQIGAPGDGVVPITFRKCRSGEMSSDKEV